MRNERHLSAGISVYDDFEVQLVCPKYVAKSTLTHCLLKVLKGTGISLGYQLTGEASATEVDLYGKYVCLQIILLVYSICEIVWHVRLAFIFSFLF